MGGELDPVPLGAHGTHVGCERPQTCELIVELANGSVADADDIPTDAMPVVKTSSVVVVWS